MLSFFTKSSNIYYIFSRSTANHQCKFHRYASLQKNDCFQNYLSQNQSFTRNFSRKLNAAELYSTAGNRPGLGKIMCLDELEIQTENLEISKQNRLRRKNKRKLREVSLPLEENENDCRDTDLDNENLISLLTEVKDKIDSKNSKKNYITPLEDFPMLKITDITKKPQILSSVMTSLKSRKYREKNKRIIIEGKRLIHDALSVGAELEMLFFSHISDIKPFKLPETAELYKAKYKDLQLWSDVVTSQGVIGIFKMPCINLEKKNADSIPLSVVCDNIRDPGNLGAILRVVAGVGCENIILTKGCADIWDPKVIRSASGAHFRLQVIRDLTWSEIENKIEPKNQIILADFNDSVNYCDNDVKENILFKSQVSCKYNLPLQAYSAQEYKNQGVVILIGGETHGLSEEAYLFAKNRKATRVYIPMSNNVESLNSGVALGIIAYEVRRQMKNAAKINTAVQN